MIKLAGFSPRKFIAILLFTGSLMAAFVDEVTSILFMTGIVLDFCDRYKVNPVNYIISLVLATNIGSSWTVLGNPIGILIAFRAGLTFEDFMRWSFPIGLLSLFALIGIIWWWQRKDLQLLKSKMEEEAKSATIDEWAEVKDKGFFKGGVILFATVIIFIALHYRLELALGLPKNTLLIATAITGAAIAMFWKRDKAREYLVTGVDWWTLTFFMFLFAKAGCLYYVGVTDRVADAFIRISANPIFLILLVAWVSAFGSAAIDNVVLVAAIIPVIHSLEAVGVYSFPLWWALLFGGCYGGNITMVGSTANIVALGVLEKRTGYCMTQRKWILIGLVAGCVPTLIGILLLLAQIPLMP
jgi:Na+/H+ antiporter NhaD/arsenite permease-like protein